MEIEKLLIASVIAAFGCVGDGCILTAATSALAFRWSAIRTGLTIGAAHLFYEGLGILLSTSGYLKGEKIGLWISIVGAVGLFICIYRHNRHVHEHHEDGSVCDHHEHIAATGPYAMLSIVCISSADAFFTGVSLPGIFEVVDRPIFLLSALFTATLVGLMTAMFLLFANRHESKLSHRSRTIFRKVSTTVAYAFVSWLFLSSVIRLVA
jgi:hypothetical protein